MDISRLRLLLELSRLGSMQDVAVELRTSTSTVSQGIAALARDVGTPLIEPDGRRVRLTPAGHRLAEHAVTILAAAHPEQANWTWSHQRDAGFVMRRMAHETAVHLWDACQAAGREHTIDGALASDGTDAFLDHFLGGDGGLADAVGGSVHLHCTDVAGEWTVRPAPDGGFTLTREHAKGDAAMRGAASDLQQALQQQNQYAEQGNAQPERGKAVLPCRVEQQFSPAGSG